jgi:aminoglycoside 6'-N-acetyltransferase
MNAPIPSSLNVTPEFRPLERTDLALLAEWLGRPHVGRWWRDDPRPAAVEASYGPMIDGTDRTEGFIGLLGERSVAFFQRYLFDDNPEWKRAVTLALPGAATTDAAGIDYLIGDEALTGQGLGRRMIARFVDLTWSRYPHISAVIVGVQQENRASWRALEGAGFRRVAATTLNSEDPSDQGPSFLYLRPRPTR